MIKERVTVIQRHVLAIGVIECAESWKLMAARRKIRSPSTNTTVVLGIKQKPGMRYQSSRID
jgi:hypothetical protein